MNRVLTEIEASTVSMILRGSDSTVARVQIDLSSGACTILHKSDGTIAVYAAENRLNMADSTVSQASEIYSSIKDFHKTYRIDKPIDNEYITEKDGLAAALINLTASDNFKSETARLRAIFDEVEFSLKSGVKREVILNTLHSKGFTMQMEGFKSALLRIRKERERKRKE